MQKTNPRIWRIAKLLPLEKVCCKNNYINNDSEQPQLRSYKFDNIYSTT